MPVNTLRAWVIGIVWAIILPGMNQFFFFRYPSVTVTGVSSIGLLNCRDALSLTALLGTPDCSAAAVIPSWTTLGIRASECQDIWYIRQPGTVYS